MDKRIDKIKKFRQYLLTQIEGLTAEQLNKIPEGFNNNIVWNLGHLICAQQGLCYLRAAQPITVDEKYVAPYRTNTKPGPFVDGQEIDQMKEAFISSVDRLQVDLDKRIFGNYTPSENIARVYGTELNSIDDALEFLIYHEGYHSGYILSLIRLVC